MHKYIVMGPQGCGKGTQAKMLEKDFDLVHISVGDIFRWQVQHHTKLGAKVKRIVASGLLVPDEVVLERIMSRRLCSNCGLDYNLIFHRPASPDVCDVCKGKLVARADDNPDAVKGRLLDYREKTQPIIDLFRRKELVVAVDGTKKAADIQAELRERLALPTLVKA
jgi:adenylate kinase